MLRALASLFLGTAALAQHTWIVDPNGGGNFTNLGVAIAVAAPFDTLVLRGGGIQWGSFVVNKPLAIVGDNSAGHMSVQELRIQSGAWLGVPVTISGIEVWTLAAQQPVTIENAEVRTCAINTVASLHRCVVGFPPYNTYNIHPFVLSGGYAVVTDSLLYSGACYGILDPMNQCIGYPGNPAVQVDGGDLTLAGCSIEGAWGSFAYCGGPYAGWAPPGPAVVVTHGTVRFTNCGVTSTAAQSVVHPPIPVYYDPSAVFSPALQGGTAVFLPATRGQGAMPGGTMQCDISTSPGLPAALAGSLGMRFPVTTSYGATWLDPNAFVVLALGVTNGAGQLSASISLPASAPRGLPITVQGFAVPASSGHLQAAAPVVLLVQ